MLSFYLNKARKGQGVQDFSDDESIIDLTCLVNSKDELCDDESHFSDFEEFYLIAIKDEFPDYDVLSLEFEEFTNKGLWIVGEENTKRKEP